MKISFLKISVIHWVRKNGQITKRKEKKNDFPVKLIWTNSKMIGLNYLKSISGTLQRV
jgi:hypothetical protein